MAFKAEWTNDDALSSIQKTGKWIEREIVEDGKAIEEWQCARCSVCGKYHTTPYLYYFKDFNYCPNCGARMNEMVKHPCQNCIYKKVCGNTNRTMPCDGRRTKKEKRGGI